MLYSIAADGTRTYSHSNHRGDVIARSDSNGSLTSFALYEAYGTRPYEWGDDPDRQKANTKEEESDLGLLNEGMRFRDLETGVFLTRDPIGYGDGPNVYCYVHCNPITKIDPNGESWIGAGWGLVTGTVSGFTSGLSGSRGDWGAAVKSAAIGGLTGMGVGLLLPDAMGGKAGSALGSAAGSAVSQSMTGDGSINWGEVAGSAAAGYAASHLGGVACKGLTDSAAVQAAKAAGELLGAAVGGVISTTGGMIYDEVKGQDQEGQQQEGGGNSTTLSITGYYGYINGEWNRTTFEDGPRILSVYIGESKESEWENGSTRVDSIIEHGPDDYVQTLYGEDGSEYYVSDGYEE